MPDRLEPGDPERIGEFWLAGRLGAGGQGVVYDAYGPDGSRVAVKVLHGAQESPRELERMATEARAAQRVASFCTARILQVHLEPPRPYIVSEYIDGLSLQDAVTGTGDRPGRRFTGDNLHRLGIGIATALAAIHQAKVVHRDLKPGNVMLGPDGPRLIDFGIARVLDAHSATEGGFAGTLRYTAPEVYAGQRAGAEADVFAWGAIMVFAATGEHAFHGGALPEIAYAIRTRDPDLSALPDGLRPLVAAALAKDPLARPSARAILAALTGDPREGADLGELVAAGAAQAAPGSGWEPGDPALGKVAEDAYLSLPPGEQNLVPEVFLRCVVPGEDDGLAARPVPAAELADRDDPDEARALERVVHAFRPLLAVTGEQRDRQVILARPAVLRAWPRLQRWIDDERDGLRVHHRIRRAARTWDDHGRRRGDVLTGARLDEAVSWTAAAGRRQSLNRLERGLLDASTRARTTRGRRVRAAVVVLAVTTVASLTATGWAIRAQRASVEQRDIAASRQLAAQSRQFGVTAPDKAALLALAAHRVRETPESRAALLNIAANPGRGVLRDYRGAPLAVSADRDGRLLAIRNEDGSIGLWDVREQRQLGGFLRLFTSTSPYGVVSAALSPDGRTLAAAASETDDEGEVLHRAVRLWDTRTHRPLGDLPVPEQPRSVVFTADGKRVAVDNGAEVALWDVRTRRRSGPPVAHKLKNPDYVVIDPRATTVAIGEEPGDGPSTTEVWDLTTGRRTASFPVKGKVVALGPGGRTAATVEPSPSGARSHVRLWDVRTGRQQGDAIASVFDEVAFSPDGRVAAIGTHLWEVGGTHVGSIGADADGRLRVVAFAGEDTAVSLGEDGSANAVRLWDVGIHQPDRRPLRVGRPDGPIAHGISADGRTLVTDNSMSDGPLALRTWDVTAGRETGPPLPRSADTSRTPLAAPPEVVAVAPDGRTVATGNPYGQIRVWDTAARRGFALEGGPEGAIKAMAVSPDGRLLATGGGIQGERIDPTADGKVQLWDLRTRKLLTERPLYSSETEVSSLAFSRDGRTLAAGIGRTVRLWNVADRRQLTPPISGIGDRAAALAFGPDGRTLAVATGNTAVLWDVRDRRQIGVPITGHSGPVTSLAFSRDGTTLATGGEDHAVNLWNVTDQSRIGAPLMGHTGSVRSLVFDAGMTTLTTSDDEATVRRWNIARPADPAAIACVIAGRTLTRAEWAQHVAPGIDYRDVCPSLGDGH